jgi:hypothetical protein
LKKQKNVGSTLSIGNGVDPSPNSISKQGSSSFSTMPPNSFDSSKYRLGNVTTVKYAWKEYYEGINSKPSITSLIESKVDWRYKDSSEVKKYSRMNKLIRYINDTMKESGLSDEVVLNEVEKERGKKALSTFIDSLSKQKKIVPAVLFSSFGYSCLLYCLFLIFCGSRAECKIRKNYLFYGITIYYSFAFVI